MKKKKEKEINGFRSKEKSPYKVVKVPLKSVINNRYNGLNNIQDLVIKINDLTIHAYQFIRLYILNYYTTEREVVVNKYLNLEIKAKGHTVPVIDEELITYCFKVLFKNSATGGPEFKSVERFNEINSFYETHYKPFLPVKPVLNNITQILAYQIKKVLAGIETNVQEHFIQHFRKFMNLSIKTENKDKLRIFKDSMFTLNPVVEPEFQQWYNTHIKNILPKNIKESVQYDVKVQPLNYLNGLMYMNSILEANGYKLFQPIPLRTNIIPKNILIDTLILIKYFIPSRDEKGVRIVKTNLEKHMTNNYDNIWGTFFKRDRKVFRKKHYTFNNQIQTDGFSCSLLFIRNDLYGTKYNKASKTEDTDIYFRSIEKFSDEDLDKLKNRPVVGCDPGKKSLVYMTDGIKKLQYTVNQRNRESKITRNKLIMEKEKKKYKIQEIEAILSQYNSKTVNVEKFKQYIRAKLYVNSLTKAFYEKEIWRKMKFRQYAYGQKSLAKFINKIEETFGKNTVIGYGDWSKKSNNNIKGCKPSMNIELRREIHKRLDTVTINEDYTSQKCSTCSGQLKFYYKDENGYPIKRLQVCQTEFCNTMKGTKVDKYYRKPTRHLVFKTRDLNSAENILNITKSWIYHKVRPIQFRRVSKLNERSSSTPVFENLHTFSL